MRLYVPIVNGIHVDGFLTLFDRLYQLGRQAIRYINHTQVLKTLACEIFNCSQIYPSILNLMQGPKYKETKTHDTIAHF